MKIILHLTKNCNLRCTYCYAPGKVQEDMSEQTARKGIDLAVKLGQNSACVSYFGGEPLLQFDLLQRLTEYSLQRGREVGKSMHFRLSTNGTLFNEERLAFCRDNNILYAISLDGDRQAHDGQRILPDGRGSFDLIDSKLDMILRYNPRSIFTSVITPKSADRLYESILYMWSRGIRYMVHQPAFSDPDWDLESFEALRESYKKLARWYIETTCSGEYFYMSLFDEKLKSHARSPIQLGEICDFGKRKISMAPDGRIFPCVQFVSDRPDAQEYQIGHADTGLNERWQMLIQRNKQPRPQCEGCAMQGRCANYCGCMNWQLTGELTQVAPILCEHERMLIPISDEIGNILWAEKDRHFLKKQYRYQQDQLEYGYD